MLFRRFKEELKAKYQTKRRCHDPYTTRTTTRTTTTTATTTNIEDCAHAFSKCTAACERGTSRIILITRQQSVGGKPCQLHYDVPDCKPGNGLCTKTRTKVKHATDPPFDWIV